MQRLSSRRGCMVTPKLLPFTPRMAILTHSRLPRGLLLDSQSVSPHPTSQITHCLITLVPISPPIASSTFPFRNHIFPTSQATLLRQVSALATTQATQVPSTSANSSPTGAMEPLGTGPSAARSPIPASRLHLSQALGAQSGSRSLALASESSRRFLELSDASRSGTNDGGLQRCATSEASLSAVSVASTSGSPAWVAEAIAPPSGVTPFTPEDVAFQPLLLRDSDGFVQGSEYSVAGAGLSGRRSRWARYCGV